MPKRVTVCPEYTMRHEAQGVEIMFTFFYDCVLWVQGGRGNHNNKLLKNARALSAMEGIGAQSIGTRQVS